MSKIDTKDSPKSTNKNGLVDNQKKESALKTWLLGSDSNIHKKWKNIGKEVYARKTLLLSAAEDLENNGWQNSRRLAATDVFVEKAQRLLARRATLFIGLGLFTALLAIIGLVLAAYFVFNKTIADILEGEQISNQIITLIIFKSSSAGAFLIAAVYFLVSLSRALLHEGTTLFNRRHALRFGRLYVYLKEGKVNFKDMEEAFKWNAEFKTAFKDIQADKITKSPLQSAIETPGKIIRDVKNPNKRKKEDSAS